MQGISGGSMSLLLGIYHKFIFSIRSFDRGALRLLRERRFSEFWTKVDGAFIAVGAAGFITGLLVLQSVFDRYYNAFPIHFSSFFFSLVLIAALLLLRRITEWHFVIILCAIGGLTLSYCLTRISPISIPNNHFSACLVGVLAGGTLVVPGVSGVFILIFFGKYQFILTSFGTLERDIIAFFVAGGILGVFVFARVIAAMLTRHFNASVAFFAGLMIGSLNKIWPWREVFEYATTMQGKRIPAFDKSILPWRYMELTGKDPQLFNAILLMALGVFMVVVIEKITRRLKTRS
jgi:putative membrane protein